MYRYEQFRENHKNSKMAPEQAIMLTICNKLEFYLSGIVDVLICFLLVAFYFYILYISKILFVCYDPITDLTLLVVLPICILLFYNIIIGFLGGHSIGFRMFGLRFARISNQRLMDKEMFFSFWLKGLIIGFKYNDTYEIFSTLFSNTNQSPRMRRQGVIIVKKRVYDLFLDDYSKNGQIIKSNRYSKSTDYLENISQIFKD
ncbi:RDD family protein [Mycoplasmatota bacterium]|nr:RDD family protein [Mycoplasmatota bacterium]